MYVDKSVLTRRHFVLGSMALGVGALTDTAHAMFQVSLPHALTKKDAKLHKFSPTNSYFSPPFNSAQELAEYIRQPNRKAPLFMAHRGGFTPFGDLPECSIEAADIAARTAPLMIEIDVRSTLDGKMYCIHDKTLERNTNGVGRVKETHSDVMKTLFLKNPRGEVTDIAVPTLEDFLIWGKDRALLWLDLKDANPVDVVDLIHRYDANSRVIVSAYGIERVAAYAKLGADLVYFVPVDNAKQLDEYLSLGLPEKRMIGFSGFDFPKQDLLNAYNAKGIPTLCDVQLDGRLQPNQLHENLYKPIVAQGVPMLNTEWHSYVLPMFGVQGW